MLRRGVLALLLTLMAGRPAFAVVSFDAFSYPVGENPKGISISDCNGDGVLDLIVANQNSQDLTVLRGIGGGRFEFGNTIASVDTQPVGAVCADFTGDGQIDVAVLSRDTGTVTIYKKVASGFSLLGSRSVGFGHYSASLATADLNGDAKPDLLVVNFRSRQLVILTGTGSNALPTVSTVDLPFETAPDTPVYVAVADFNKDSHPDIAIASSHAPFLAVLFGDGVTFKPDDAQFSPFALTRRPARGRAVATADLNHDGNADLAVLSTEGTVALYLGNGTGGFAFQSEFLVSPNAASLGLADLDGDGKVDMALVDDVANSVEVLWGTGPARFMDPGIFPSEAVVNPGEAATPRQTVDVEDSALVATELLHLSPKSTAPALEVLNALEPSGLSKAVLHAYPRGVRLQQMLLVDLTNDGLADAVVTTRSTKGLRLDVLRGNTTGGFDPPPDVLSQLLDNLFNDYLATQIDRRVRALFAADLDADGKLDLLLQDARGKLVLLADGDGEGRFRQVRQIGRVSGKAPVVLADFTGDGALDVAALPSDPKAGTLALLVNDGLGTFATVPIATEIPALRSGPILAADLDRNGFADLAYAAKRGWTVLYNEGDGPTAPSDLVVTAKAPRSLAVADFDEDGWPDVLATFRSQGASAHLYHGRSDRRFDGGEMVVTNKTLTQGTVVDINDDLHEDVVLCGGSSAPTCELEYGDGRGRFSPILPTASASADQGYVGRQVRGVAAADLDGDGRVDFVAASRRDSRVVVLFQEANGVLTRLPLVGGTRPRAVAVGDVNGDTRPDILVVNEVSNDLSIFLNQGGRQLSAQPGLPLPKNGIPTALAVADLNGDHTLDVVVTQNGTLAPNVVLGLNDGAGGFTSAVLQAGLGTRDVALADLSGDDLPDIIVANSESNNVTLLLSNNGGYTRKDIDTGGLQPSGVAAADMNGDGRLDLVVVNKRLVENEKTGAVVVLLNNGAGGFGAPASIHARGREVPSALCLGDVDGDGKIDAAVAGGPTNDIMVLRGRGDGTWLRDERTFPIAQGARALFCTDVNGDGKADVVFGGRRGSDVDVLSTGP